QWDGGNKGDTAGGQSGGGQGHAAKGSASGTSSHEGRRRTRARGLRLWHVGSELAFELLGTNHAQLFLHKAGVEQVAHRPIGVGHAAEKAYSIQALFDYLWHHILLWAGD